MPHSRVALAILGLLLAHTAEATVVIPASFEEMVAQSQLIVYGQIVDVRPQMTGARRTIESVVTVDVLEILKGQPGRTIAFRVPNGQLGRYRRITVGAPEFAVGEEVIIFLKGRAPIVPMPFGLAQGVYRVGRTADGSRAVTPPVLVASGADAERLVRGDASHRPLPIAQFTTQVRSIVERQP